MKAFLIALLLVMAMAAPVMAEDNLSLHLSYGVDAPSTTAKWGLATYSALLIADWFLTSWFSPLWGEGNPILGQFPTQEELNVYAAWCLAANYVLYSRLNRPYREIYLAIVIACEIYCVYGWIKLTRNHILTFGFPPLFF